LIPARVVERRDDHLVVAVGNLRLSVPGVDGSAGDEVQLCLRPESLRIGVVPLGDITLPGTVIRSAFLGDLQRYWLQVGDQEWVVDHPDPGAAHVFAGPVVLSVQPERVHVIGRVP
jgi:ABC-type Fe3+/spermidine/putrescine transport system ATPase subunit